MFKIRASAASQIIAGSVGLTDKQEDELKYLLGRPKPTPNQLEKINKFQKIKDNPELPEGAKTYCKSWLKGKLMGRSVDFSNKYTEKGHIMEDEAIDFASDQLDLGFLMKNEESKENEFMRGTCDVLLSDQILDVKNSWTWETFPLLENELPNKDYYWQGQVYMHIYGRKKFKVIYTLLDTPIHLIEREAYNWCRKNGYEELEQSVYERFYKKMTYSDIPDEMRIKVFEFEYSEQDVLKLIDRVKMCKEYIESYELDKI